MTAFRIAAQMIAHQAVETVEILPHVRRAGCNIDPRRRSKPEHPLHPVQHGQQALQRFRIESTAHFDSAPPLQLDKQNTAAPGVVADIALRGGNHFDRNKSPAPQLPSTMHALTIFIQRPHRQAPLLAKRCTLQAARFKLRNKHLCLSQTTSSVLHSQFAHSFSASLNAEREQSALLRRIRLIDKSILPELSRRVTAADLDEITLMSPGDIIFLYTDKVFDGDAEKDRQKIEKIIQEHKQMPAREICNAILDYALRNDDRLRQIDEPDQNDDKTVFIIKREREC